MCLFLNTNNFIMNWRQKIHLVKTYGQSYLRNKYGGTAQMSSKSIIATSNSQHCIFKYLKYIFKFHDQQ